MIERLKDLRGQSVREVHRDDAVVITGAEYLRKSHLALEAEMAPCSRGPVLEGERDRVVHALARCGGVLLALLLADRDAELRGGLRVHEPSVLQEMREAEAGARAALESLSGEGS